MKPYDWMVTYTPQTGWVKGGGAFVWLSFFTGLLGGGAYLASLYFGSLAGTVVSWLVVVVLKGGFHVGHTKRPLRLWRMVLKVRTSWIARGTLFTALIALFGALQIILSWTLPGTPAETVFKVLTAIAAFAVMIYEGFTINYISGIPFWNSSLLPASLISWGILSGLSVVSLVSERQEMTALTSASRVALIVTAALTILYLWNALYAEAASKESMKEMLRSALFWVAVVLFGIVIPLAILFGNSTLTVSRALAFLVCEIVGTLAFTYSVLKVGVYRPLI
jgi:formate-dependent nitrite reductase membrane component NrfD